jgi:hypothetical protein
VLFFIKKGIKMNAQIRVGVACLLSLVGSAMHAMTQDKNSEHAKNVLKAAQRTWNTSDKEIRPRHIQEDTLKIWNQALAAMSDDSVRWFFECSKIAALRGLSPEQLTKTDIAALATDFNAQCVVPLEIALKSQRTGELQVCALDMGLALLPALQDWLKRGVSPFEEALRERAMQESQK